MDVNTGAGGGSGGDLARYRSMRDFDRTPEPAGDERGPAPAPVTDELGAGHDVADGCGGGRFVVQEHQATSLHWDLRLERDGVAVSWAVPKGIPPDPRENHLAVHTEDHPLQYLDFEGDIPEGEYGGGRMTVWDSGTYTCEKWEESEVMVTLSGRRARGRHVLFRTGGNQWMLHRLDPPEDPDREPMPHRLRPLVIAPGPLPGDESAWSFEPAFGGHRVVVASEGGRARAMDGDDEDVTARYPELRDIGRAIGAVMAAIEGELVVTGPDGHPDAEALIRRRRANGDGAVRRLASRSPATFFADDLVWLEGHDITPLAYRQRRLLLERLDLAGPGWLTAPVSPGDGTALLAAARDQGLAGVVARRLDGRYERGSVRFVRAERSPRRPGLAP